MGIIWSMFLFAAVGGMFYMAANNLLPSPYRELAMAIAGASGFAVFITAVYFFSDLWGVSLSSIERFILYMRYPYLQEMELKNERIRVLQHLDLDKILALENEPFEVIYDHDQEDWQHRIHGREFWQSDLITYIQKSAASHPEAMSLKRLGNNSTDQMTERAMIELLKRHGFMEQRSGQVFRWVKSTRAAENYFSE